MRFKHLRYELNVLSASFLFGFNLSMYFRKKPNRPPLAPAPAAPVQDVKPLAVIPPAEQPTVAEPARQTLESSRNRSSSRSRRKSQKVAPTGLAAVGTLASAHPNVCFMCPPA